VNGIQNAARSLGLAARRSDMVNGSLDVRLRRLFRAVKKR